MSWFSEGYKDYKENKKIEEQERIKAPFRFFLSPGEKRDIIFVDDRGFQFWEHVVYREPGNFRGPRDYYTCCERVYPKGCPLCAAANKRSYMTMYTILDTMEWEDKNGIIRKNSRKLLPLKGEASDIMESVSENLKLSGGKGLIGYRCTFKRGDERSISTGIHITGKNYVDLNDDEFLFVTQDKKKHRPQPFKYEEIFKPLPREKLIQILTTRSELDSVEYGNSDDIPF